MRMFSLFKKVTDSLSGKGLGKIPGVIRLHEFIYKVVKPKGVILITCQGNKMYVDGKDEGIVPYLLMQGVYDKRLTKLFKKLIKPGMIVVDVGANIGYYTLIVAKLTGNDGRVYAFEPEPNNYRLLVKNIEMNGYTNITPIQKALSNKHGKTKLFADKVNLGQLSFSEDNTVVKAGFVDVETTTLDDFFESVVKDNKVDLVKID
ncbi:MAG: FkbM family methyltransferase, partial [Candidatus Brocadiales bacterium]